MRLGLLTAPFDGTPLPEVARWAVSEGIDMLEVASWPAGGGEARRYAGTAHLPVEDLSQGRAGEIVDELGQIGATMSALGYYPNNLHPDPQHRAAVNQHTRVVIRAASRLGVPVVNTFVGADPALPLEQNYEQFRKVFPDILAEAADLGVKVAIENCPMIFSMDEWPSGKNIAYNPKTWRRMFEDMPGDTLGLNLDPSHLLWQMIDVERVVEEFADRIYHVHVKDLEIDRTGLYENGVLSAGMGWQRPRLPGLGEVNWPRFVSALYRVGYDHVLCIEHEDRRFEGTDELVKTGFLIGRDTIRPLLGRSDRG